MSWDGTDGHREKKNEWRLHYSHIQIDMLTPVEIPLIDLNLFENDRTNKLLILEENFSDIF